jgi:hypothetical protein
MENNYFDEIHKKNTGGKGAICKFGIVAACVIAVFIILFVITPLFPAIAQFALLLVAAAVYGAYILMRNMNEEYEYIYTDGEVDIDVIRGRSARKRMITVKPKDVEIMAKATGAEYQSYKNGRGVRKVLNFSDNNPHNMYFVVSNSNNLKKMILFSPSQRLIDGMKFYLRDRFK